MQKKLEKLYYKSIDKESREDLKEINKMILKWIKNIENKLGFTFYETYAIDMPNHNFDIRDIEHIKNSSEIVAYRDKEGFYGIDDKLQNRLNEIKIELDILHNLITRKEEIMNADTMLVTPKISKEELKYISEQLGYGSVRENILENQARNKKKSFVK